MSRLGITETDRGFMLRELPKQPDCERGDLFREKGCAAGADEAVSKRHAGQALFENRKILTGEKLRRF